MQIFVPLLYMRLRGFRFNETRKRLKTINIRSNNCNTANRTFPKLQDLARNTPFFKNKGNAKSFSSFGQTLPPLHLEAGK
ncbi:hypothetical protein T4C_13878 [Trichinella pseudospiralis]|uniref:Uncharacterized protein n=1 Tax=Trichinella pseudospiralis TaxID=6337 RepID=A0A0V1K3V5_TRIPS|nr:hypothetical protein T4C_13878 [Trichinella pseudospiralis]